MSAATVTPAEIVREGHAVLHVAMETGSPRHEVLEVALASLGDALDTYTELDGNGLHWECVYPHLRDEADPDGEALRKAADEVNAATEDLIRVIAANSGTKGEMTIPGVGK